jgi:hypothetical protein
MTPRVLVTVLVSFFALTLPHRLSALDFYPITSADKAFLSEVVDAIRRKDAAWIADRMAYPVSVVTGKARHVVNDKKEFTPILRRALTRKIRAKLKGDAKKPLFKNWRGVMVGDGILWYSQYSLDSGSTWTYFILAIGDFAFQANEDSPEVGPSL